MNVRSCVPNIICFQTQKQLAKLNNIQLLLKSVLIDLRGRNFVRAKIFLRARCLHARNRARNLSSPVMSCGSKDSQKCTLSHVLTLIMTSQIC